MDAYAGTIHQCRVSASCCFSGICRTGSYVRHKKFYNRHRKNYVRLRKFYVRHRKRAVSTPPGRTVKPFHNDNRCVARSDTCGIHHKSRRSRRRSNRYQPHSRHLFDLFKVVPSFVAFPQVAHSAHHTAVSVCWTASPSICIRASRSPHGRTRRSAPTTHRETCRACLSSYTLLYIAAHPGLRVGRELKRLWFWSVFVGLWSVFVVYGYPNIIIFATENGGRTIRVVPPLTKRRHIRMRQM